MRIYINPISSVPISYNLLRNKIPGKIVLEIIQLQEKLLMSAKFLQNALALLLISMFTACSSFRSIPEPNQADMEKEEQAVFSVFMPEGPGPALILQTTSTNIGGEEPRVIRDHIKNSFEGVSNDLVENYLARNAQPSQLSPDMDLGVDYVLMDSEELAKITRRPNWHQDLIEKYPGSNGYLIFSHVGFNRSLDKAVVYVGNVAGPLMGSGSYYLLEKQNGTWTVKEETMVWIS
jgi:hypothetical protein